MTKINTGYLWSSKRQQVSRFAFSGQRETLVFCFSKETGVCGSKHDICLGEWPERTTANNSMITPQKIMGCLLPIKVANIPLFYCRNERETPNMCFSKESGVCGSKHGIMFGQITRANHREQFNDYPQKIMGCLLPIKVANIPLFYFFVETNWKHQICVSQKNRGAVAPTIF